MIIGWLIVFKVVNKFILFVKGIVVCVKEFFINGLVCDNVGYFLWSIFCKVKYFLVGFFCLLSGVL